MTAGESQRVAIRGLEYHVRSWGPPDARPLVLLHGWMDCAASWRFMVDALTGTWRCIAPDWRGFGDTEWSADGVYTYADYYADLDALLDVIAPGCAVHLVGHSMGGNIACGYTAARPERVKRLVNVEGFGLRARAAADAPGHLRDWLDELRRPAQTRPYPDLDAVIARVRGVSARITPERADFIARHWARQDADGTYRLRADPRHRRASPTLYRLDEALALAGAIRVPTLWIEADETENIERHGLTAATLGERREAIPGVQHCVVTASGHMIQWDQPARLAEAIEAFFAA